MTIVTHRTALVLSALLAIAGIASAQSNQAPSKQTPAKQAPTPPAQVPPAPATPAPAQATPVASNYLLGPQDVLSIVVYDQPDLGGKFAIELDGTFTFPFLGRISAGGRTLRQLEEELRTRLKDGYFKDPQLAVSVEEYHSQRVFVVGEVRNPGTYSLTRDMTLVELLSRAGSTTPGASDVVTVVRARAGAPGPVTPEGGSPSDAQRINLKDLQTGVVQKAVELHDGDTVYVGKADEVFVFGEVKAPGAYPMRSATTVLQALSLAGGVTSAGAMGRIRIMRTVNGVKKELSAKLTDLVQPGDTITVPERFF